MLLLGRNTQKVNIFQCKYHLGNLLHAEQCPSLAWLLCESFQHWTGCGPRPGCGVCQGAGEAPGKPAIKGSCGEGLCFLSQLCCPHRFSRMSVPREAADVNKQKVPVSLDNCLLKGGEKGPKVFMPKKKKTFLCKYSVNLISVVGEIQASSHLLNSPMFLGPALCLLWGQCCSSHPTSVRCLSIRGNYLFSAGLTVSVLCWPQAGFWVQLCAVKAQVRVLPLCLTFQPILMLLVDFSQNQAHGRELWASKRFMAANWEWGRETLEVS